MKKINNKGFAISILIYSLGTIALLTLLVILGTLSGMRKNESTLVDSVKDDLNDKSRRVRTFDPVSSIYTYKVPKGGTYKIQLWGATGGSPDRNRGGLGGYVSYTTTLTEGHIYYIVVGQEGGCPKSTTDITNQFTSGGLGHCAETLNNITCGCTGGGATIIAKPKNNTYVPTTIADLADESKYEIKAVAGGGGGAGKYGGAGGPATGTSKSDGTSSAALGTGTEMAAGNIRGTSATPGGSCANGTIGTFATGHLLGGENKSPYYKAFSPSSFGTSINGYSGAGGGGGYCGGGAASGSYVGAGGGSNYINTGSNRENKGGNEVQPKQDLSGENTNTYIEKVGSGYAVISLM